MSRIPESTIERIKVAVDIVDLIGERVELTRRGRNWTGLCPFHVEKTPSFNVNPEWGTFKCFGCGRSGSAFGFLMDFEQMTFREAVIELGRQVGIPVEVEGAPVVDELGPLREAVEWACGRFEKLLWSPDGERARGYLQGRGFTRETLEAFRVGYAPESWSWLLDQARRGGPSLDVLVKAGLAKPREKGGAYDAYRDRVIFPILDRRGRPIGFGGRIMPDNAKAKDAPKYINSPESPLYRKSRVLYGYHQGRDAIRRSGRVVVVEGYTDVMMAHQSGVAEVVACCGTALTPEHAQLLGRIASSRVLFLFDGDAAGQGAAEKSLEHMLPLGREVLVASLPDGADPHEFLMAHGSEAFEDALAHGRNVWEFKLDALAHRHDMSTAAGMSQAIDELLASVRKLANPVERDMQLQLLAKRLGVDVQAIKRRARQLGRDRPPTGQAEPPPQPARAPGLPAEAFLLEVLAHRPDLAQKVIAEYPLGRYRNEAVRRVAEVLYARLDTRLPSGAEPHPGVGGLIALLADRNDARLLHDAVERTTRPEDLDRPLVDYLDKHRQRDRKREAEDLKAQLRDAELARDTDRINAILEQYRALMRAK